jgi:hypothetical protein
MGKCIVAVASVVGLATAGSAWAAPTNAPRAVVLKVGETQRIGVARLRPGDEVHCVNDGHVLSVDAPSSRAISNGTVWTQAGTTHFHLHVTAKSGGGYVVDCGLGGFHWSPAVTGTRQPRRSTKPFFAI